MKMLPITTQIPANLPHVKVARGVLVPDAYAAALQSNPLPLGDYVEAVTKATGIKRFVEKLNGGKCGGCGRRKARLNEIGAKVAKAVSL